MTVAFLDDLLLMFRIEEHELLGEGAFGQVFKATVKLPNAKKQTAAVKKMKGNKQNFVSFSNYGRLLLCVKLSWRLLFCK